jgi:hypothetical protein
MDIVIAKYKEDISWVNELGQLKEDQSLYIYDKSDEPCASSIPLPNVGREAHTFLYHICSRYNELPKHIMFLQGKPFDHSVPMGRIKHFLEEPPSGVCPLSEEGLYDCNGDGRPHHPNLQVDKGFQEHIFQRNTTRKVLFQCWGTVCSPV